MAMRVCITKRMNTAATKTFEILLASDKWTTRETRGSVLEMLNKRGVSAVKRGYTTWALFEGSKRVGSMQEIG